MNPGKLLLLVLLLPVPALAQPLTRPAPTTQPITAQDIQGVWKDGEEAVEIRAAGNTITFQGKYLWSGLFDPPTGALELSRIPSADEMSPNAPLWARERVYGRLRWSMKLKVGRDAGGIIVFTGTRDLGKIEWQEHKDEFTGQVTHQIAAVGPADDQSNTITITRTGPLIPKVSYLRFVRKLDDSYFLVEGAMNYEEPLYVEIWYDIDPKKESEDLTLNLGAGKTRPITVRRAPGEERIFRSEAFYLAKPATPATRPVSR